MTGERGIVEALVSHGVVALFGAPLCEVDDAFRAVQAARAAIAEVDQQNRVSRAGIRLAIGMASGEALVGDFGGARRVCYTAVGGAVERAAELRRRADSAEILMDETTWEEVRSVVSATPVERDSMRAWLVAEATPISAT